MKSQANMASEGIISDTIETLDVKISGKRVSIPAILPRGQEHQVKLTSPDPQMLKDTLRAVALRVLGGAP